MSEGPVRRTAPIQASAVVGLSRLMDHDHVETLARINAHQRALIAPRVAEFHGHLAGQSKENLFAEFDDLAEAVQCAVEIQRGMGKRNASVPRQKRVEFRFGVAYGELITDGEWVYGDGVEEAARVEAAAEPGGVCLTESAVEEVRGAIGFPFEAGEDGVYRVPSEVLVPPPEDVSSVPRPTLQTRGGASAKRPARRQARARKRRLVWSAGAAGLLIVVAGGVVSVIDWGDSADPSAPAQSNVARASLQSTVATAPARPARELDAVEAALRRGDVGEAERLLEALVGGDELAAAGEAPGAAARDAGGLDPAEVEAIYRRILEAKERDLGPADVGLAPTLGALAALLTGTGRHVEAEALYRRALALREAALGPDHPDVAATLEALGTTLRAMGRAAEATLATKRAEDIRVGHAGATE